MSHKIQPDFSLALTRTFYCTQSEE